MACNQLKAGGEKRDVREELDETRDTEIILVLESVCASYVD